MCFCSLQDAIKLPKQTPEEKERYYWAFCSHETTVLAFIAVQKLLKMFQDVHFDEILWLFVKDS